jgi:pimeloyl-ACP methyl ester carboxylesterase
VVVDPIWLLKAIGLTLAAALVCGYASLCLLLYQGQWQLILHPKQTTPHPATLAGAPVEFLRFGPDESATPQRTAWVIPAAPGGRYASFTILFLPPGDGSLADSQPTLALLHDLGLNVFAIDYRGYGESAATHPNQARMTEDAESALQYLTTSRAIPEGRIVPYGVGIGASLATQLAAGRPAIPAIVLESPAPDALQTILHDPRTRYLPVRALVHERFPLAEPLAMLKTPKLLLYRGTGIAAFQQAAAPKLVVSLPETSSQTLYNQALLRFLDQYLAP